MVRLYVLLSTAFLGLVCPPEMPGPLGASRSAAAQCVRFDVPHSVAATIIPPSEDSPTRSSVGPQEKLVQFRLPISAFVQSDESQLELLIVVSGTTTHPFQVVDFAPKTVLATDIAGLVSTELSEDDSTSIGIHALSPADFPLKADANAKLSQGTRAVERLERMPPKQVVSASGTLNRGRSVYFRIRPSTQTTLEGDRTLEITARVSATWRASLLQVQCSALVTSEHSQRQSLCTEQRFVVGGHLAGDAVAKASVEKLASAQHTLTQLARTHARSIENRKFPSIGHKFGAALSFVDPKIPDSWLQQLLNSGDFHRFERHLPRPVRDAATDYRQARAEVIQFAG